MKEWFWKRDKLTESERIILTECLDAYKRKLKVHRINLEKDIFNGDKSAVQHATKLLIEKGLITVKSNIYSINENKVSTIIKLLDETKEVDKKKEREHKEQHKRWNKFKKLCFERAKKGASVLIILVLIISTFYILITNINWMGMITSEKAVGFENITTIKVYYDLDDYSRKVVYMMEKPKGFEDTPTIKVHYKGEYTKEDCYRLGNETYRIIYFREGKEIKRDYLDCSHLSS